MDADDEAADTYNKMYRSRIPAGGDHRLFIASLKKRLSDLPLQRAVNYDSTIPDSLKNKQRFNFSYLGEIQLSWEFGTLETREFFSLEELIKLKPSQQEIPTVYKHDGLLYRSTIRMGMEIMNGRHFYCQVPLTNDGYYYRVLKDEDTIV